MTTLAVKRKRGRPRREGPTEINEFDITLIREFSQRPAFYDRSCVLYRNREYLELQWVEIANKLGFNVTLVKDRMIQLRNRYNLEKRRAEALQRQYNDTDISSQWPLFEYMSFLGEHIKSRRSQSTGNKSLKPAPIKEQSHSSNSSDGEDFEESQNYNSNDTDSEQLIPSQTKNQNNRSAMQKTKNRDDAEPVVSNRSIRASMPISDKFSTAQVQTPKVHQPILCKMENVETCSMGAEKFKAFGQFLAASLMEMNEADALRLVDKFTSELVRSLRTELKPRSHNESANEPKDLSI